MVRADDAGLADAPDPDAAAPDALVCPAGYVVVGALPGSYRYSTTGAMWLDAELDCENDGTGTHLAIIDTAAENTALHTMLLGTPTVWFGLSDRVTEGSFRTVTNVLQTYLPWGTDEPTGNDDCVGVDESAFTDENCTDVRPYLCECDGIAPVPASYTP